MGPKSILRTSPRAADQQQHLQELQQHQLHQLQQPQPFGAPGDAAALVSGRLPKAQNPQHLQYALQKARELEQRKEIESRILGAIETLIDYPLIGGARADPKQPTPDDAASFTRLVSLFQPSDYDALVEERHAAGRCGYALCPRGSRKLPGAAKFRILHSRDAFKVVPREKLEHWCGDDCARRALYVKVQLAEEPAWLRSRDGDARIDLLVEGRQSNAFALLPRLAHGPLPADAVDAPAADSDTGVSEAMAALNLEPGGDAFGPDTLMRDVVLEKETTGTPTPPSLSTEGPDGGYQAIEGYQPASNS
ncbi:Rtr1/RPAP2 family-domain-containing protein [Lineolata rhizophorae]|uniref:RNA polymerase II subunit B1 CTD phosphatase RPAP2 homolog n=1 Tax=Lineolata rhizophorae TaxID=578093 RepID=A0A6A6NUN0_9PEZI|nr:Rtr1/RPAP2 family-domain-containing protein [Lineolata rhizophorae]